MLNLLLVVAELPLPLWFLSENSHIVLWADVGAWVVDIRALGSGKRFYPWSPISAWDVLRYVTVEVVPEKRLWMILTMPPQIARPGECPFSEDASIFKCDGDTH